MDVYFPLKELIVQLGIAVHKIKRKSDCHIVTGKVISGSFAKAGVKVRGGLKFLGRVIHVCQRSVC